MLSLATALPLAAVVAMLVAGLAQPTYSDGSRVPKPKRTPWGNLAYLCGRPYAR